jgi:hypothetical protein
MTDVPDDGGSEHVATVRTAISAVDLHIIFHPMTLLTRLDREVMVNRAEGQSLCFCCIYGMWLFAVDGPGGRS